MWDRLRRGTRRNPNIPRPRTPPTRSGRPSRARRSAARARRPRRNPASARYFCAIRRPASGAASVPASWDGAPGRSGSSPSCFRRRRRSCRGSGPSRTRRRPRKSPLLRDTERHSSSGGSLIPGTRSPARGTARRRNRTAAGTASGGRRPWSWWLASPAGRGSCSASYPSSIPRLPRKHPR